jgi:hypothetical protein
MWSSHTLAGATAGASVRKTHDLSEQHLELYAGTPAVRTGGDVLFEVLLFIIRQFAVTRPADYPPPPLLLLRTAPATRLD